MSRAVRPSAAPAGAPLPARVVVTDACREDIRRALTEHPLVLLIGRASASSGAQAIDLAVSSAINGATELAKQGVVVHHLLPLLRELKAHHRTTATMERTEALDGGVIEHRWSVFGGPQLG